MEAKVVYFEELGKVNTDETLALAGQRSAELGIKTVVVASTSGDTGVKAVNAFQGLKVVVVTHCFGSREPDTNQLTEENRKVVESKGGRILTGIHAFGGINQAVAGARHSGPPLEPGEAPSQIGNSFGDIIGSTLGFFSRGTKVACEITIMAADAGLVRTDEEVIAIAGTRTGADTAVVIQPSDSNRYYNLRIKQIICKPRL